MLFACFVSIMWKRVLLYITPLARQTVKMPLLIDEGEEESLLQYGTRRTRRLIDGFMEFATEGNVLEIAFGLMYVFSTFLFLRMSAIEEDTTKYTMRP